MIRKIFILAFIVTCFVTSIHAQCTFEKVYPYHPAEHKTYTINTSDGGFLTVMSCYYDPLDSFGNDIDMAIVKNDSCGNTLWQMHYGDPNGVDFASGCIEMYDGNYLVAGSSENGPALSNFRVVKFSKNGNMIWDSVYNGIHESVCVGITKRKNRNSAFIYGYENLPGMQAPILLEIDENGNTLKKLVIKNHPNNYPNYFEKLIQPNDTTYDLICYSKDTLYLIQTDTSFNIKLNKPILFSNVSYYDACITNDNKTIVLACGNFDINSSFNMHIYMYDISSFFLKKTINLADSLPYPYFITTTRSEGFLIGDYLLEVDSNIKYLNTSWYNLPRGVIFYANELFNGSIIASGVTALLDSTHGNMYIIKTDSVGKYAYSGIHETQLQSTDLKIYPNPATNELHIVQSATSNSQLAVSLFDVNGKQVLENIMFIKNTTINLQKLSQGLYFVRITNANGVIVKTQKVAVCH